MATLKRLVPVGGIIQPPDVPTRIALALLALGGIDPTMFEIRRERPECPPVAPRGTEGLFVSCERIDPIHLRMVIQQPGSCCATVTLCFGGEGAAPDLCPAQLCRNGIILRLLHQALQGSCRNRYARSVCDTFNALPDPVQGWFGYSLMKFLDTVETLHKIGLIVWSGERSQTSTVVWE